MPKKKPAAKKKPEAKPGPPQITLDDRDASIVAVAAKVHRALRVAGDVALAGRAAKAVKGAQTYAEAVEVARGFVGVG